MDFIERMNSGKLYSCYDLPPELRAEFERTQDLVYDYNMTRPSDGERRKQILQELIPDLGEGFCIEQPFHIACGNRLHIGKRFYANFNMTLVNDIDIYIGDNVMFASGVTISVTGHPVCYDLRPRCEQFSFPVHIGNNVWIGTNVIILPGVTIGDNAVIGAGSVVTKDIPANVVALGTPCKVLREITDRDREYYYHDLKV